MAIGPPQATKSYLVVEAILDAARHSGADAIHPGYGFLSERSAFVTACLAAELVFVGPGPDVIDQMGDKARARDAARAADVPTIPGSDGTVDGVDEAAEIAATIGYPVMLKAAGGGGGRGIRVVGDESELRRQFPMASGEAGASFGDPRLYLERFVTHARHVEIQVLGDGSDVVHLYERECSLQRRRQKVVEEALSPGIGDETRAAITQAATRLAASVGYSSAGTVEFLVDDDTGEFFFIEMNTRIQVEHPTTEMVCGVDLVAEQLRIAAGDPLRVNQNEVVPRGCAVELRICAEDPAAGFLPSPGRVDRVDLPAGPWVRVDTWLESSAEVSPFYDSLLAKMIVWGEDRATALSRTRRALREFRIEGVKSTVPMFRALLDEPWMATGSFHTGTLEGWIDSHRFDTEEPE